MSGILISRVLDIFHRVIAAETQRAQRNHFRFKNHRTLLVVLCVLCGSAAEDHIKPSTDSASRGSGPYFLSLGHAAAIEARPSASAVRLAITTQWRSTSKKWRSLPRASERPKPSVPSTVEAGYVRADLLGEGAHVVGRGDHRASTSPSGTARRKKRARLFGWMQQGSSARHRCPRAPAAKLGQLQMSASTFQPFE